MQSPRLCCLDLDTFFVSVERLFDPTLIGKAVVVGGHKGGRGVVTSASYEARAFGVRSGMSIRDATALAPNAVFLPGRHGVYGDYSEKARAIVERYSPVVVAASIDEQYIDFRGCEGLYRQPGDADDDATITRVVREMTDAIERELGLPSSAGVGTSKSMAKVACGLAKPRGVLLVPAGTERELLAPLGVRKLPGIGPVAEAKLARLGIATLGEPSSAHLRRPKTHSQFLRAVYADVLGRGPQVRQIEIDDPSGKKVQEVTLDEEQNLLQAFDGIGDPAPLRAEIVAGLCDAAEAKLPEKSAVNDPSAYIRGVFERLLGREPTAYELAAFEAAWRDDPAVGPKTVMRGILGSREYQSQ